jgi:hypothetical protein
MPRLLLTPAALHSLTLPAVSLLASSKHRLSPCKHLTTLSRRCQDFREVRTPLWPTQFPVHASVMLFGSLSPAFCVPSQGSLGFRKPLLPNNGSFLSGTPQTVFLAASSITATLGKSGWLALTLRGLSPHKKRQVSLAHAPC